MSERNELLSSASVLASLKERLGGRGRSAGWLSQQVAERKVMPASIQSRPGRKGAAPYLWSESSVRVLHLAADWADRRVGRDEIGARLAHLRFALGYWDWKSDPRYQNRVTDPAAPNASPVPASNYVEDARFAWDWDPKRNHFERAYARLRQRRQIPNDGGASDDLRREGAFAEHVRLLQDLDPEALSFGCSPWRVDVLAAREAVGETSEFDRPVARALARGRIESARLWALQAAWRLTPGDLGNLAWTLLPQVRAAVSVPALADVMGHEALRELGRAFVPEELTEAGMSAPSTSPPALPFGAQRPESADPTLSPEG